MRFCAEVLNIINALTSGHSKQQTLIAMQSIVSCQIDNRLCCITVITAILGFQHGHMHMELRTAILGLASAWTYAHGVKNCMFLKHQSAVRALESGDSSVITPCTVGQEVAIYGMLKKAAKFTCDHLGRNMPNYHCTRSGRISHLLTGLQSRNGLNTIDRQRICPWAQVSRAGCKL